MMEFSSLIMDRTRAKELVELAGHNKVLIFDEELYKNQNVGDTYRPRWSSHLR